MAEVDKVIEIPAAISSGKIEADGTVSSNKFNVQTVIYLGHAVVEKLQYVIVDKLPANGQSGTLYFVKNDKIEGNNQYDEYMWVNGAPEKVSADDVTDYHIVSNIVDDDTLTLSLSK